MQEYDLREFVCRNISDIKLTLESAMNELFSELLLLQANEWDTIRFEFWSDTGRIIVFPSLESLDARIDSCGIQLTCDEVLIEICDATNSDMDESEYEKIEESISRKILGVITQLIAQYPEYKYAVFEYGDEQLYPT